MIRTARVLVVTAFSQAQRTMLEQGEDPQHVEVLRRDVLALGQADDVDPEVIDDAREIDWMSYLTPDMDYRLGEARHRLSVYPDPRRLLPTRLGNQMRAAEDELPSGEGVAGSGSSVATGPGGVWWPPGRRLAPAGSSRPGSRQPTKGGYPLWRF